MSEPCASTESSKGEQQINLLSRLDFPKSLRLLSAKDFQQVFAKAEKFANSHWTFIVRPNNLDIPRLGLAISKKQLAKSVWRNRVKRVARESFRQHKDEVCGYDIVVLARRGIERVDRVILAKSFSHLINKVAMSDLKFKQVKEQA